MPTLHATFTFLYLFLWNYIYTPLCSTKLMCSNIYLHLLLPLASFLANIIVLNYALKNFTEFRCRVSYLPFLKYLKILILNQILNKITFNLKYNKYSNDINEHIALQTTFHPESKIQYYLYCCKLGI